MATAMIDRLMRHGEAMVIQGSSFRTKGETPTSSRFRVITFLRLRWQPPCVPSGIRGTPVAHCSRISRSDAAFEASV
jgi:hypothetical protein